MAELAHGTQPEFWRPPVPRVEDPVTVAESATSMAEACPRCATEYLLGSRFCHSCGARRPEALSPTAMEDVSRISGLWLQAVQTTRTLVSGFSWPEMKFPSWLRYLSFHEIKSRIGLSTASFVAFLIGLGCVGGALLVGFLTARTLVEWQAVQFYRAEWLLGATVAFVAGILLKKPPKNDN
ncbi:MAG TPA: zinc ribbon domain-containing protein [Candidatus Sulfotelmatobacter sp.]|nr:zinc ribbon domain-containing protein [Candidatus Sulfotelmatobacter sp.]